MGRRAVACRERLPRYNKRSRVRAEVLEEVRETVEDDERDLASRGRDHRVVCETYNDRRRNREYFSEIVLKQAQRTTCPW